MFSLAVSYVLIDCVTFGGDPVLREGVVTDNGNMILDVYGLKITNPKDLEDKINAIAGVVTVGLFAHRGADVVITGTPEGAKIEE